MTENHPRQLLDFLMRAKRATYASGTEQETESCRPASHDLRYEEPDGWLYMDSYLGSAQFAGQEAVWKDGTPLWAMNYCGHSTEDGFDGDFLKEALMHVSEDAPYRGPIEYQRGSYLYCNTATGDPRWFFGREEIFKSGVSVYECVYHGGLIR